MHTFKVGDVVCPVDAQGVYMVTDLSADAVPSLRLNHLPIWVNAEFYTLFVQDLDKFSSEELLTELLNRKERWVVAQVLSNV